MSAESEALQQIDARIAMVRDNLRELIDRASGTSGAADEELTAQRIAEQEAELARLKNRRSVEEFREALAEAPSAAPLETT